MESVPLRQAQNDNANPVGLAAFTPSTLALFLPTIVIAALYGGALLLLMHTGQLETALARLLILLVTLGVPLIAAHAFLRFVTIRLQPMVHAVFLNRGFPAAQSAEIPYERIASMEIKRGLIGMLTGSGSLILVLHDGKRLTAAALKDAAGARDAIAAQKKERAKIAERLDDLLPDRQVALFMY